MRGPPIRRSSAVRTSRKTTAYGEVIATHDPQRAGDQHQHGRPQEMGDVRAGALVEGVHEGGVGMLGDEGRDEEDGGVTKVNGVPVGVGRRRHGRRTRRVPGAASASTTGRAQTASAGPRCLGIPSSSRTPSATGAPKDPPEGAGEAGVTSPFASTRSTVRRSFRFAPPFAPDPYRCL